MTQSDLSTPILATPLAGLLAQARNQPELVEYRGVLTPRSLNPLETEIEALAHGAALYDLGWKRRIAVRGEDRFRWLSGMVTNTVNDLFPNTGAWNFVLNAQGHILGDVTVWRGEEEQSAHERNPHSGQKICCEGENPVLGTPFAGESGLELVIDAQQSQKLLDHLNHFIIMDDVELAPLSEEANGKSAPETVLGLTGPHASDVLERLGLPSFAHPMKGVRVEWNGIELRIVRTHGVLTAHYEFWVPASSLHKFWQYLTTAGATPVGSAAIERFRIAEGIPAYGIDIQERDLPQETSQTRALHFNKGCYQGQEIVERIHARGQVRRHLRSIELSGAVPTAGTSLTLDGGAEAGRITSVAELPLASGLRKFALAVLSAEAETGDRVLHYKVGEDEGSARILATPPTL
ncbi:YgfZ/GcvT domain-containing protein [Telmatobacter bradus]|uniref:CAF17-like 4Fe-4S cluster assembly/insertion protein YgfZ n=1 Tax=Telmatobacter bradus TaxID=474953 RepID=UPI003B4343FF